MSRAAGQPGVAGDGTAEVHHYRMTPEDAAGEVHNGRMIAAETGMRASRTMVTSDARRRRP